VLAGGRACGRWARARAGPAALASGVVGVTGPGPLALGREAGAPQRGARVGLDLPPLALSHPLTQGRIRGAALRTTEGLLQAGEPGGCERHGRAGGEVWGPPGGHAPDGIARRPLPEAVGWPGASGPLQASTRRLA
jgi:hypothetical protein